MIRLGRANKVDGRGEGWRKGQRGAKSMVSDHKTIIGRPTLQLTSFTWHWRDIGGNDIPTLEGRDMRRRMGN
jgi:hypothetical protein